MVKDQYPASGPVADLFDRVAARHPEAKADRRDGLRLDWPDRWVHVRASNTEPIVRVIAEAAEPDQARALAERRRPDGRRRGGIREQAFTTWPEFAEAPAVAFIDVDGTLLAETTTYLYARILRRRGLIRNSFLLRAMYHGLQHKFGRLDYGRLINYGLSNIASIPVVDLERIAYENFVEHVRPGFTRGSSTT